MIFFLLGCIIIGIETSQTSKIIDMSYSGADRASDMRDMNSGKK